MPEASAGQRIVRRWLLVMLLGCMAAAQAAPAPLAPERLEAFVDGLWYGQRAEHDLAGAVVTIVQGGDVLLSKGYGYADVESRRPVDPERTLFRIASISKPFTWIAVMQLVEQGRLDLDEDVNAYIEGFDVPSRGAPITMRHLMSHAAGYEDQVLDLGRRDAADLVPLGEYLATHLPRQVREPGVLSSYSNHSTALAAHIVAEVSGQDWSSYLEEHVLGAIGMTRTVARHPFPEALRADLATPHELSAGAWSEQDFLHWFIYPAGMMSTTGADMAKFMLSLLADAEGLLEAETFARMLEPSFRPFEGANAWLHGFMEYSQDGELIYGHGGDLNNFHSNLMLFPERDLGVFLSFNSEEGGIARSNFARALRDWLIPQELPERPVPAADAAMRQADYAGVYAPLRRSVSDFAKLALLLGGLEVHSNDEGWLLVGSAPTQFVELGADRFGARYAHEELAFRRDASGRVTHLSFSGFPAASFERLAWHAAPGFHRTLYGFTALLALYCVVYWPVRAIRRRLASAPAEAAQSVPAWCYGVAWLVAVFMLYSFVELALGLRDQSDFFFGIPANVERLLLLMPLASIVGVLLASVLCWRLATVPGRGRERVHVGAFVVAIGLYVLLGLYWNTLTWHL